MELVVAVPQPPLLDDDPDVVGGVPDRRTCSHSARVWVRELRVVDRIVTEGGEAGQRSTTHCLPQRPIAARQAIDGLCFDCAEVGGETAACEGETAPIVEVGQRRDYGARGQLDAWN